MQAVPSETAVARKRAELAQLRALESHSQNVLEKLACLEESIAGMNSGSEGALWRCFVVCEWVYADRPLSWK